MEKLSLVEIKVNELKTFLKEKQSIVNSCKEMVDYYNLKLQEEQEKINEREANVKNEILAMIDLEDFKETKTQLSFTSPSLKITKKKATQKIEKNEIQLLDFLKENRQEFVKVITNEKIDWQGFKKELNIIGNEVVDTNGEVVKGCSVATEHEKIEFKIL